MREGLRYEKLPKRNDEFEQKWSESETMQIGAKNVNIYDVNPEHPKTDIPAIVGLGWSLKPENLKGTMQSLYEHDRRVICPDTPHGIDTENTESYPAIELRKVAALVRTLDERRVPKADIVANSEGGIFAVLAAYLYPERFRNLVLVNPAGMIGKDNLLRLNTGFSADVVGHVIEDMREKRPSEQRLDILSSLKTVSGSPLQATKSALAMADSDLRDMLKEIRKRGVGIEIIYSVGDQIFPPERIMETIGIEHTDALRPVAGRHNTFYLNPEPYAEVIDEALDELQALPRLRQS